MSRTRSDLDTLRARGRLVALAKHRARKAGTPFDLSPNDFHIPARCPALGIRLVRNIGGRTSHDASPTLDRINPRRGYVPGNVIVISRKANTIKSNSTPRELERVASFVRQLVH